MGQRPGLVRGQQLPAHHSYLRALPAGTRQRDSAAGKLPLASTAVAGGGRSGAGGGGDGDGAASRGEVSFDMKLCQSLKEHLLFVGMISSMLVL